MATHALGKGTVNLNINLAAGERKLLGQLALEADQSLGNFIRGLVFLGLSVKRPEAAVKVKEIRETHRKQQRAGVVCLLAFCAVLASGQDYVRGARRTRREDIGVVEVAA